MAREIDDLPNQGRRLNYENTSSMANGELSQGGALKAVRMKQSGSLPKLGPDKNKS